MKITFTARAIAKALEILGEQDPKPDGLRIKIVGGGCSGFMYNMHFEDEKSLTPLDKTFAFGELKVFIDPMSLQYLNGTEVDYVETFDGGGFKFNNPQIKSTCGCGQSFET